ncbi:glucose-6-phosphate dehydrogenase [Desertihabitans aurantiacus]|uniref:glucose-6-phosphate dehydrogenase n=1 Tax=Desertihabitans aurantiacus TaxID=2282477 RepID=UPI000DF79551|nr:glucose-6-phosphate dehydrogenase [Desertihabitans aurantiacus]
MAGGSRDTDAPPEDTVTLAVLGAGGDLFARLLLPGLASLLADSPGLRVTLVGAGRRPWDDDEFTELVRDGVPEDVRDTPAGRYLLEHARWATTDATDADDLRRLLDGAEGRTALYFALPPSVTIDCCAVLAGLDLPDGLRLVAEKPFGTDRDSAAALNERMRALVDEEDIHRVDHFLGLPSLWTLLSLRLASRALAPLWHRDHVESVDIVWDETLGLEGRAGFYDGTGALVDMVQSHLLQVLAVVAMEPPAALTSRELRDQTAAALRATSVWDGDAVASSRRARYTEGSVDGRQLPSYVDEDGVDPSLETETLAELTVQVATGRWTGVPFRLRSGKALGADRSELRVTLRPPAHRLPGLSGDPGPEVLVVDLRTGDLRWELTTSGRGDPFGLERTALTGRLGEPRMEPYGEVLRAVFGGDARLSVRGDAAERCWEILAPVQEAWRSGKVPLEEYAAGSDGPG